jgi:hypothetical protein
VVTVPRRIQDESTGERLRRRADECRRTARVQLSCSDGSKTDDHRAAGSLAIA